MQEKSISVENVSKVYRLGSVGSKSFTDDFKSFISKVTGQGTKDKNIEENDRTSIGQSEYVYALKDINFEVNTGEVLGVIGKNGAGKSTLLKILSKITSPSTGEIKIKGRMASLLEVGTGFHPELSGRENIFLNGSILGMRRHEIAAKFDEIVEFSGVSRFVDTPVKRYSSGMYVRLAFAVAAHLEPEILVIDEVLAVGDSEFQKKCLGKMKDVSGHGRTVLFVSHNMAAIKQLCNRAIFLKNGQLLKEGDAKSVVDYYLKDEREITISKTWNMEEAPGNENIRIKKISVTPANTDEDIISIETGIKFEIEFINYVEGKTTDFTMYLFNQEEIMVFETGLILNKNNDSVKGHYKISTVIPAYTLNSGEYHINIIFGESQRYFLYHQNDILSFEIEESGANKGSNLKRSPGILRPNFDWKYNLVDYV